jgi:hypothetical protein
MHSEFLMAFLPQDANRAADATVDKKCGRIKSKKRESPPLLFRLNFWSAKFFR